MREDQCKLINGCIVYPEQYNFIWRASLLYLFTSIYTHSMIHILGNVSTVILYSGHITPMQFSSIWSY